jgi:hypothetical protein
MDLIRFLFELIFFSLPCGFFDQTGEAIAQNSVNSASLIAKKQKAVETVMQLIQAFIAVTGFNSNQIIIRFNHE